MGYNEGLRNLLHFAKGRWPRKKPSKGRAQRPTGAAAPKRPGRTKAPMVNIPLIRPYFLWVWHWGGPLRFR